jgi:ceramide glucosyltransferase
MIPTLILLALLAGALVYSALAVVAALRYLAVRPLELRAAEPVSILKPLAGLDADLELNLRTFFEQDYPAFEILFAVRHRRASVSQCESFQPGPDATGERARPGGHER